MADWVRNEKLGNPDMDAIENAVQSCEPKISASHGSLEPLREKLYESMWQKVGIIRDEAGLRAALTELSSMEEELNRTGIADRNRAFNLSWHDWLNLKSLVQVSRVIAEAALARTDSRGAHFRGDFPETGPLESSAYSSARFSDNRLTIAMKQVAFSRVRPGATLLGNRGQA